MAKKTRIHRRTLLKSGLALPAIGAWPAVAAGQTKPDPRAVDRGAAKNVIFLVADGMSSGVPSMAEPFSRLVRGTGTQWCELAGDPAVVRGFLETGSLNSLVTDSAAAASSWATGSRVFNGSINMLPDGRKLMPLGRLAHDTGRAIGVVSTATVTHATPAAACTVARDRIDEFGIAPQFMEVADVVLGGGHPFFSSDYRPDGRDLYTEFARRGYYVCRTSDQLRAAPRTSRILGIFSDTHLPYHIDVMSRRQPPPPRLAELTRAALDRLGRSDTGFMLHIEGARVDHAAHANDAAAMLWEQLEFDDAIAEARRFAERHPDTLVVVTTDHAVGNPGLIGVGPGYADSNAAFEHMASTSGSFDWIIETLFARSRGAGPQWNAERDLGELMKEITGVTMSPYESQAAIRALSGMPVPELSRAQAGPHAVIGQIVGNTIGVGWTGTTHTSDLVSLLAFGPGSEAFAGLLHHTDVFDVFSRVLGVTFRNPSMTWEEAKAFPQPAAMRPGGVSE